MTTHINTAQASWQESVFDPARLGAVRRTGLGRGADPAFDRLATACAGLVGAPVAVITIVGEDRVHLVGAHGLPTDLDTGREWPLDEQSVCGRAVHERRNIVIDDVADASSDLAPAGGRFRGVRAVASLPIYDVDGYAIGAVCVLDVTPRSFPVDVLDRLLPIAQLASRELRLAATMPAQHRNYRLGMRPPSFQEWMPSVRGAATTAA